MLTIEKVHLTNGEIALRPREEPDRTDGTCGPAAGTRRESAQQTNERGADERHARTAEPKQLPRRRLEVRGVACPQMDRKLDEDNGTAEGRSEDREPAPLVTRRSERNLQCHAIVTGLAPFGRTLTRVADPLAAESRI